MPLAWKSARSLRRSSGSAAPASGRAAERASATRWWTVGGEGGDRGHGVAAVPSGGGRMDQSAEYPTAVYRAVFASAGGTWENGGPSGGARTSQHERRKCRTWLRAAPRPTGSPVSRTRSSPRRSAVPPGKPVVVRLRASAPPGPIHLGNLREVMTPHLVADEIRRRGYECGTSSPGTTTTGSARSRPASTGVDDVLGRAHRQAADLRARPGRHPRTRTGPSTSRPPMTEALGRAGRRVRRHQPDRAVHLGRLPRADPARDAHRARHRRGPGPLPHQGQDGAAGAKKQASSSRSRSTRPSWRPPRAPARPPRTTAAAARRGLLPVQAVLRARARRT